MVGCPDPVWDMVAVGAWVSTLIVAVLSDSTLPAESTERNTSVWAPSTRVSGPEYVVYVAAPSSLEAMDATPLVASVAGSETEPELTQDAELVGVTELCGFTESTLTLLTVTSSPTLPATSTAR